MNQTKPTDSSDRDPRKVAFGNRVRTLRELKGFTQQQLAGMIGLTENSITQYEGGRAIPRPLKMEALAVALGTNTTYLLTGNEPDSLVRAQTRPELEALEILRDIPLDQQETALAALRGIAQAFRKKK
ncbi:hypothetical protein BJI49_09690 [Acetobacter pasteurianus]|uniref:HTH cro/C1-type domain-containing protein n=1 Tax=Acetobacter ascendens TaxID=481146 RepID=A0A1Y0V0Y8_9PROT|nr:MULTISPECIES: helix-turn-helix transcriptional regulator [Acetobacter]ARW11721.1 hypothetical protein S101447_02683 [Acetobacter ascendens]RCL05793.1 hypothetical protein BJI49_09690 [Acetobacter pasteurianus]GAB32043.1 hypothetical protein APS_2645 [Acetobacter pasteurianus subsp. pasteurianus LMG 1262 = NBRC 106471]GCD50123.1 hypothetical protein NBRC106471_1679 [Acetobacter pasteurianus subsp. pasteurianus LMG 1262 = NBRC 106471]